MSKSCRALPPQTVRKQTIRKHFSECVCRDVIAQEISRIEVQEFTLEQWNDALSYLTSLPKQKDSEMAKALLIKRLGKRCH